jgi:hypothetical protein
MQEISWRCVDKSRSDNLWIFHIKEATTLGPTRHKAALEWRKLHNEKSRFVLSVINPKRTTFRDKKHAWGKCDQDFGRKASDVKIYIYIYVYLGVYRRYTILNWTYMKEYVKLWATFSRLEIVSTEDFCEDGDKPALCIQQLITIVWRECKRKLPWSKVLSRSGRTETDNSRCSVLQSRFERGTYHTKVQNMTAWPYTIGIIIWSRQTVSQYLYSRTPLIRTLVIRMAKYPDRLRLSGKHFLTLTLLHLFMIYIFSPTVKYI